MSYNRRKSNKGKSVIIFTLLVVVIAVLAYAGSYGLKVGNYRFKSFGETINKGLDLQGGVSMLEEIQADKVDEKL